MLIRRAEVFGLGPADVRIEGGTIIEVAPRLSRKPSEEVFEAGGGALIPGLHDHHIHLRALAAAGQSVRCGPPEVNSAAELERALASAPTVGGWTRGIGYHESVAGKLDRWKLDRLTGNVPVRIQHRSGMLWIVNSRGAALLGLDDLRGRPNSIGNLPASTLDLRPGTEASDSQSGVVKDAPSCSRTDDRAPVAGATPGIEYDDRGRATGRLFRADRWLRARLGPGGSPDWAALSRRLACYGLVALTDATASNGAAELAAFERAAERGELLQRVIVMGSQSLPEPAAARIERGAVKLVLDEHELPELDALADAIRSAHASGRRAAVHCVTRASLLFALAAFEQAGTASGDRIEHASVAPPQAVAHIAELGLAVVTQPGFVYERGDTYLRDVDESDRPWLYRLRGLLRAGVPLAGSTDAPLGGADPWVAMRAAVERRSRDGAPLGPDEALTPEEALALFTSVATEPGRPSRTSPSSGWRVVATGRPSQEIAAHRLAMAIGPGRPAELCLLDRPWKEARTRLGRDLVRAVWTSAAGPITPLDRDKHLFQVVEK
ncbi:MAG: amidohydrolase [Deltaproteobacteria bacterium]|nr:MAG: amidohydrolase [Deltaproteobacteria bacterium]